VKFINYVKSSIEELKKVVWPTSSEISESAQNVLVSVFLLALFFGAIDLGVLSFFNYFF